MFRKLALALSVAATLMASAPAGAASFAPSTTGAAVFGIGHGVDGTGLVPVCIIAKPGGNCNSFMHTDPTTGIPTMDLTAIPRNFPGGLTFGATADWLGTDPYTGNKYGYGGDGGVVIESATGFNPAVFATRTSDTHPSDGFGLINWCFNDYTVAPQNCWAQYDEARRFQGAGAADGNETNITEFATSGTRSYDPYGGVYAGGVGTAALRLLSGGSCTILAPCWDPNTRTYSAVAHPVGGALGIQSNGSTFLTGIWFGYNALEGSDGTTLAQYSAAIKFAIGQELQFDGCTSAASVPISCGDDAIVGSIVAQAPVASGAANAAVRLEIMGPLDNGPEWHNRNAALTVGPYERWVNDANSRYVNFGMVSGYNAELQTNGDFEVTATYGMTLNGVALATIPVAWIAYTPTLSSSAGAITASSASGYYQIRGKTMDVRVKATITTAGAGAGGSLYVQMPPGVTTQSGPTCVGAGRDAVLGHMLQFFAAPSTTVGIFYDYANSSVVQNGYISEGSLRCEII